MKTVKDTCSYEEVNDNGEEIGFDLISEKEKLPWRNFLRQMMVCSTLWTMYFIVGLQFGAPTVLISQIRKEPNSTLLLDDELASWITSMVMVGAYPWTFILPILVYITGRKKLIIFICLCGFIGTTVVYLSDNIAKLLIGEFIIGILLSSGFTISPLIIAEFSSPKYRGIFLTIKSASVFWGIWVANAIGTFFHWKNIYILMFVCNAYTLSVCLWPESPYWLAKEQRFIDCAKIHRKLKGKSKEAEEDLEHIINQYKLNQNITTNYNSVTTKNWCSSWFEIFTCKAFYKPMLLIILLAIQYTFMGKLMCSIYAVQILKKITGAEEAAYKGMLILDGVTVFGAYCGCIASRRFRRRTLLFSTSIMSIVVLYILAIYLFLTNNEIINERNYIPISLLTIFSVSVCSGPMILVTSIYGELVLIRYQRPSAIIHGSVGSMLTWASVKISLFLFRVLTLPGTFLFFATTSSVFTFILYLYLPETKSKRVQEIEKEFMVSNQTQTQTEQSILQPDSLR